MFAANDVEAVSIAEFVFELTALVIPLVAPFVFELTCEVIELEADWISDRVASDPELSPAPVRVLVAADHTSVARVPKVVRLLEPKFHMTEGREVIIEPIDVEAVAIALLVFPLITAAREVVAVSIALLVFELTADVIPEV